MDTHQLTVIFENMNFNEVEEKLKLFFNKTVSSLNPIYIYAGGHYVHPSDYDMISPPSYEVKWKVLEINENGDQRSSFHAEIAEIDFQVCPLGQMMVFTFKNDDVVTTKVKQVIHQVKQKFESYGYIVSIKDDIAGAIQGSDTPPKTTNIDSNDIGLTPELIFATKETIGQSYLFTTAKEIIEIFREAYQNCKETGWTVDAIASHILPSSDTVRRYLTIFENLGFTTIDHIPFPPKTRNRSKSKKP